MTMMAGFLWRAKTVGRIPSLAVAMRRRSSKAGASQVVEVDMAEYDVALKHFDDLIHRILVKKATPDWLPFVPGSSFWVPPRPSPTNVVDLVHKLTREDDRPHDSPLLSTLRGWPSSNFFINENESSDDDDTEMEVSSTDGRERTVKVKVLTFSENVAHSEDEDS
ncbi:hypothetical protein DEO72_LG11g463 [Vigna unguiculata]|uniref:Uncharacterized protein n=1 Tax=Vigna unguiculata TaxID=3917 RepID=A0A4D6NI82_VIGUN|nr:hypothetical protein DEO72_LG11g463 [Vigna unguiculata]